MNKFMLVIVIGFLITLSGCMAYGEADYDPNAEYLDPNSTIYTTSGNTKTSDDLTNEEYTTIMENTYINTNSMSVSTFSVDVDTASYSNVRRLLNDDIIPNPNAVRIEELLNYFTYDFDAPTDGEVINVITEIAPAPWNTDHQLLMVGLKTEEIDLSTAPANNLVFLLDVSGSMNSEDKLPLLKNAMKLLVNEVRAIDRISIVVYAGAAGVVLDGADGSMQEDIIAAIDSLEAGGSTAGGAGINLAYSLALDHFIEGGNNRVILATDGDFNVGVSSTTGLEELIEDKRDTGIFLSVVGFGTGNLKDNKMETLADKGNGVYYYIDSLLEAKKVFVDELGGTLVTVAKDVKLQIEFNPLLVKGYRLIGYENRLLDYQDFNDDTKDAGDMGSGHEMIAFYELIPATSDEVVDEQEFEQPDELKYDGSNYANEYMTLSIRYKDPESSTSQLFEHISTTEDVTTEPSEAFRFASSIVEFGLVLRDSEFKGNADLANASVRATNSLGTDEHGHRAEFLTLIQKAMSLLSD